MDKEKALKKHPLIELKSSVVQIAKRFLCALKEFQQLKLTETHQ